MARIRVVVAALAVVAASPVGAAGQETTGAVPDSVPVADSLAVPDSSAAGPGPSGAFLRGAIIPGWGHAASGSLTRGAFYFGAESLAGWMLFKTVRRLGVARRQAGLWEDRVTARLMSEGITDPMEIELALEGHEQVARFRGLVDAREEQREDWTAVAIFTLLLSGVDAFVSAHLQDFPDPLTIEGDPTDGRVEVGFRIPSR
ncbi:MAG: hypothetical protein OXE96_14380 [Gemmatimonadetes bacterium]|nr:hypothetical protein [Gemmatimonadota bacterium]